MHSSTDQLQYLVCKSIREMDKDIKLEKAMNLPPGHFAVIRKAVAEVPAKVRKGLRDLGYPRLKVSKKQNG